MTNKQKKVFLGSITALLATAGLSGYVIVKKTNCPCNVSGYENYQVERVIDGDTIRVNIGDKQTKRLRLLSIDAPELDECFGREAGLALKEIIKDKNIKFEKDLSGVDKFGRLLRYLIIESSDPREDSLLVNHYLVRNGFAFHYSNPPDNRYRDLLVAAQKDAKKEKLGMWGECDYAGSKQAEANKKMREEASRPTDPDCIIKGNISEKGYGKTYLIPGCDNYNSVKIDTKKGEAYFCTAEEAEQAGFRKATNCPKF